MPTRSRTGNLYCAKAPKPTINELAHKVVPVPIGLELIESLPRLKSKIENEVRAGCGDFCQNVDLKETLIKYNFRSHAPISA